ncbi:MAG: MerC domain-containing protein [Rhodothermales bacterium]
MQATVQSDIKLSYWDRVGIAVSGICVVHCLLLPVALAVLPLWPLGEALHGWLHPVFALLLVPTTVMAAVSGYRKHRQQVVVALLGTGLVAILVAGGLGYAHPGVAVETALTLCGSGLLIAGHWRNWRATLQGGCDRSERDRQLQ